MWKKLVSILLCLCIAGSLAGCKGKQPEASKEEKQEGSKKSDGKDLPILRVAVMPSYYSACASYVADQGWDTEEGFKIELISFTSGPPMNEALAAGLWDVAGIGVAGVHALAQYDAKMVAELQTAAALDIQVRADSDIAKATTKLSDGTEVLGSKETVKGKTLLCPAGSLGQYYAGKWLEALGLTIDDINFVHMELAQAYQAFQTGEGDIACLRLPDYYYGETDLGYKSVVKMPVIAPQYELLMSSKDCFENKKDLLKKFTALQFKAQEAMLKDDELAKKTLRKWYDDCGYETSDEAIEVEVNMKTLLTAEKAGQTDYGKAAIEASKFMIDQGQMEKDKLDTVKSNITPDILIDLGYKKK